ncbi:high-potential iron-sulfur protein [Acuticoccus sp. MNP-M23]|uniref:high-potential iron-sulfur protein n=1 Tax=Acuticoccus sp. MNP-M23 TaxID=3072793 RepID=UPI002814CC71|nr:high-potential iron-sulfur protein [Acuticoccus sp. MNP-M23]WMS42694.1 high-potential iron-sulfur protein [Acuticoccus sp. MNP-M23]
MPRTIIRGLSRRQFMGATLGVAAAAMATTKVNAQALEKSAVQYQEEPKGEQNCANCAFFVPGADAAAMGSCQMVQGEIHPDGWCAIWAPKA